VSDLTTRASTTKILGLTALVDLVVGLVLAGVGVANDNRVLAVVGLALVVSGGGVLAFVVWSRSQPEPR
jgi:hypothetical protein